MSNQVESSCDEIFDIIQFIASNDTQENNPATTRAYVDRLKHAGLGSVRLSKSHGGRGISLPEFFGLVISLANADSNVAHIFRNHFYFVEKALRNPSHPQYSRWINYIAAGKTVGSAVGELGTPSVGDRSISARLVPDKDGFRISAEYFYSTGNFYAEYIYARAMLPDESTGYCLIPVDREGVILEDDWDGFGQRRTASGTTIFNNVRVAREEVLDKSFVEVVVPHEPTHPQLYLTAVIAGIMQRVADDAVKVINTRQRNYYHAPSARPADDPILLTSVGRLASAAFAARSTVLSAAQSLEQAYLSSWEGKPSEVLFEQASLHAAQAKIVVDALAQQAASELFDVGGASAVRQSAQLDRHWRNIRTIASHNPASYKAHAVGNVIVNNLPLPKLSFF